MSAYDDLRPPGLLLVLLLRAAVADPADGPWLTVARSEDSGLITHHITVTRVSDTPTRLTLLSGLDVLSYAHAHRWTPDEVRTPTNRQISSLRTHAILHSEAGQWAQDYSSWTTWRTTPEHHAEHQRYAEHAEQAARSLRHILAKQWLTSH
ncbi:hypothetical protein [Kitasatospora sp. NPDC057198]|uniref:hypothetical protein n=1 Tax=Kitasatospora sp. NPDC057198 TaxID=3346046 RepID=UPI00363399E7